MTPTSRKNDQTVDTSPYLNSKSALTQSFDESGQVLSMAQFVSNNWSSHPLCFTPFPVTLFMKLMLNRPSNAQPLLTAFKFARPVRTVSALKRKSHPQRSFSVSTTFRTQYPNRLSQRNIKPSMCLGMMCYIYIDRPLNACICEIPQYGPTTASNRSQDCSSCRSVVPFLGLQCLNSAAEPRRMK